MSKPTPMQPIDNVKHQNQTSLGNLVKETKSYILDYVLEANHPISDSSNVRDNSKRKLSIQEAKKRGILNVEKGLYIDQKNNSSIPIDEAINLGLIGARVTICEKNYINDEKNSDKSNIQVVNKVNKPNYEASTSTLTIDSVLDTKTSRFVSISDAIKMGILDQSNLSYVNTSNGQIMSLNEAFMNGCVRGNRFHEKENNSSLTNANLNESNSEECYKIKSFLNPLTNTHIGLDEAIQHGLFDKERGILINPTNGQKMNLNEALSQGFMETEAKSDSKNILIIDVVKPQDKQKDTLLYQVNEIEEFKFEVNKQVKDSVTKSQSKINIDHQRVEEVIIDDEEETEEEEQVKDLTNLPINMRKRPIKKQQGSSKLNIQERRIRESICGSVEAGASETLIIDDVRQSVALDIDGITHVLKNECVIDCDYLANAGTSNSNNTSNNTTSSCISSLSSSPSKNSMTSSSSESSNLKKLTNNHRTVIVVDDQLISYGKQKQQQDIDKSNQLKESYDTLKIDVRKSANLCDAQDGNIVNENMHANNNNSSTEFMSNSERAQFERVNTRKDKNSVSFEGFLMRNFN